MISGTYSKQAVLAVLISILAACGSSDENENENSTDSISLHFSSLKPAKDVGANASGRIKNNPPDAINDYVFGLEDELITGINVLANDIDTNGDVLSVVRFSQGAQGGAISMAGDGSLSYQPSANFAGTDQFSYTISDGKAESSAVVTVQIENVNDLQVSGESYTLASGTILDNMDLLANDVDADGDLLFIANYTQGVFGGLVEQTSSGLFRYTPVPNFSGIDEFSYTVVDNNGGEATAIVTVLVELQIEFNVSGETYSVNEDSLLRGLDLLANDSTSGGRLSIVNLTQGSHGGLVVLNSSGLVDYTPVADFHGVESFDYTVINELGMQRTVSVTINVISVNDVPVANPDNSFLDQSSMSDIDLLSNDSGFGDGVTLEIVSLPLHGSVTISESGVATYTPEMDYSGTDEFTYKLFDVDGDASITTVTLNIECLNNCGITYLLNWVHSISADVAGYKLYAGTSSGTYSETLDLGYVTEHLYTGDLDSVYFFAVSAVDSNGVESELSAEISTAGGSRAQIQPVSVTASSFEIGNAPGSSIDNDLLTRWAAYGLGEWIEFDLGSQQVIEEIQLAWYNGNQRAYSFEILTSIDNVTWTYVYSGQSSAASLDLESYDVTDSSARYVRVVGNGNSSASTYWNSITEAAIFGTVY